MTIVGVVGVACDPLHSKDELSFSPVVAIDEVAEEKTCGGGNSLLCLILHCSSSTFSYKKYDYFSNFYTNVLILESRF